MILIKSIRHMIVANFEEMEGQTFSLNILFLAKNNTCLSTILLYKRPLFAVSLRRLTMHYPVNGGEFEDT